MKAIEGSVYIHKCWRLVILLVHPFLQTWRNHLVSLDYSFGIPILHLSQHCDLRGPRKEPLSFDRPNYLCKLSLKLSCKAPRNPFKTLIVQIHAHSKTIVHNLPSALSVWDACNQESLYHPITLSPHLTTLSTIQTNLLALTECSYTKLSLASNFTHKQKVQAAHCWLGEFVFYQSEHCLLSFRLLLPSRLSSQTEANHSVYVWCSLQPRYLMSLLLLCCHVQIYEI